MTSINLKNKTVLITGSAGFIGSNLVSELLKSVSPIHIVGIYNMNDYYDVSIKEWRLAENKKEADSYPDSSYIYIKGSISDKELINKIFAKYCPNIVVNLAAQAGVRYSITNPSAFIESNPMNCLPTPTRSFTIFRQPVCADLPNGIKISI